MSISDMMETLMLGCFSLGWYWSIFTMVCTRRPYGKSAVFVSFTVMGYLLGLTAQALEWQQSGVLSYLLLMYAWNLCVTVFDLSLLGYLSHHEKKRARLFETHALYFGFDTTTGAHVAPKGT